MRKLLLVTLMILALLVAGCGGQTAPTETEAPAAAEEPAEPAEAEEAGEPAEAEEAAEEPAEAEEAEEAAEEGARDPIVVASKDFTEQFILGWMTVLALENAGIEVEEQINLGGTAVNREALEAGDVDIYWEYTGTAWLVHLGHEDPITDPQEAYDMVQAEDMENSIVWLDYAPFNNTYTLMVRTETQEEQGLQQISDLQAFFAENTDANICVNQEFSVRPDGLPALQEQYGLEIAEASIVPMETGVTYRALLEGQCDVAMGFATDGRIAAWNLTNLADDQQFFPVYNPAPVVREEALEQYPEIADILNPIAQSLDTETMTRLNSLVDVGEDGELDTGDEMEPQEVARQYLQEEGFIE